MVHLSHAPCYILGFPDLRWPITWIWDPPTKPATRPWQCPRRWTKMMPGIKWLGNDMEDHLHLYGEVPAMSDFRRVTDIQPPCPGGFHMISWLLLARSSFRQSFPGILVWKTRMVWWVFTTGFFPSHICTTIGKCFLKMHLSFRKRHSILKLWMVNPAPVDKFF